MTFFLKFTNFKKGVLIQNQLILKIKVFYALLLFLQGCQDVSRHLKFHDPHLKTKPEAYESLTEKDFWEKPVFSKKPVQKEKIVFPQGFDAPVSLTFIEQISIREALIQLADQAGVSLSLAPNVMGDISLTLNQQPFGQALDAVCQSHQLRFFLKGKTILVEKDTAVVRTYHLPFLNGVREDESQISLATDILSPVGGKTALLKGNGSYSVLKYAARNDLWKDIRENIEMLLMTTGEEIKAEKKYSLSESGGVLSVYAPEGVHQKLAHYFKVLNAAYNAQVLIEVKIIDVSLNHEFQSGINWHAVKSDLHLNGAFGKAVTPGKIDVDKNPDVDVLRLGTSGRTLQTVLGFLSRFGTVRTLSSPRLTVMNNQSAMMKVATNRVFFRLEYTREPGTTERKEVERAYSQIQTVPVGFLMTVRPAVDTETGRIMLHLRPTMSRVSGQKNDPAVGFLKNQQLKSEVPEIQIREMETTLSVYSGESIALGGLMEESADNERSGLPGGAHAPVLSPIISGKTDKRHVSELVIFLRASLVQQAESDTISKADRHIYKTFCQDPRSIL